MIRTGPLISDLNEAIVLAAEHMKAKGKWTIFKVSKLTTNSQKSCSFIIVTPCVYSCSFSCLAMTDMCKMTQVMLPMCAALTLKISLE